RARNDPRGEKLTLREAIQTIVIETQHQNAYPHSPVVTQTLKGHGYRDGQLSEGVAPGYCIDPLRG
ncbi:MAG: hypothetical protein ABSA41_17225, partial [Terriglobia bacterium]